VAITCLLILPADLSTSAMLFGISLLLMFIARVAFKHLLLIVGSAVGIFGFMILVSTAQPGLLPRVDTWKERVVEFGAEESEESYQTQHSKIAIATGGLIGKGPSKSTSRNFLPHPYSDMIYAFVIEEYGAILGGMGTLFLFLILLYRSIRIATKCEKTFSSLLATGLSLLLVGQGLINMGVAVDLLPVTGQPLPLVSMGGTSIWFTCVTLGIILSVSREVEKEPGTEDGKA
jgi:cell division protein FtsW